jgi:hypothetical protein
VLSLVRRSPIGASGPSHDPKPVRRPLPNSRHLVLPHTEFDSASEDTARATPTPTNCQAAAIRVEPGTGSAGTDVEVAGESFLPNTVITVSMYGYADTLTMSRTDESGAFLATFTVPAAWKPEFFPLDAPDLAYTKQPRRLPGAAEFPIDSVGSPSRTERCRHTGSNR